MSNQEKPSGGEKPKPQPAQPAKPNIATRPTETHQRSDSSPLRTKGGNEERRG